MEGEWPDERAAERQRAEQKTTDGQKGQPTAAERTERKQWKQKEDGQEEEEAAAG